MSWQDRVWKISKLLTFLQVVGGVLGVYCFLVYFYAISPAASAMNESYADSTLINSLRDLSNWLVNNRGWFLFGGVVLVITNCVCVAFLELSGATDRLASTPKIIFLLVLRVVLYTVFLIASSRLFNSYGKELYFLFFIVASPLGLLLLVTLRLVWAMLRKLTKGCIPDYVPSSNGSFSTYSSGVEKSTSEPAPAPKVKSDVYKQISKRAYITKKTYIQVNFFHDGKHMWTIDEPSFRSRLEEFSLRNASRYGMTVEPNLFNKGQIVDADGKICWYDKCFTDARGDRCMVKDRL
ncbi:MAG: hypothetical protein IJ329_02170 [Clostridia bacterium]|nr:hypothetical protein [Clostridia bacterium]